MSNDIWNKKREKLESEVRVSIEKLVQHVGFCGKITLPDNNSIYLQNSKNIEQITIDISYY